MIFKKIISRSKVNRGTPEIPETVYIKNKQELRDIW